MKTDKVKKVKEDNGNIKDFAENKVIAVLTKPKALSGIILVEDKEDPWFVYVLTYRLKSGVISENNFIIAKDVPGWVSHLKSMGFEKTT